MKRLLIVFIMLLSIGIVYAGELNITIEDVTISDNSDTVDVT